MKIFISKKTMVKRIKLVTLIAVACFFAFAFLSCNQPMSDTHTSPLPSDDINVTTVPIETEDTTTPEPTQEPCETELRGMPVIRIETEKGVAVPTNKSTVECTVSLECNLSEHCQKELGATVRVRGNGSLSVANRIGKYPYKLDFDKKINLFGLGDAKAKEWVLNSNTSDRTMLRNFAAKRLGDMLSGIPFSPNSMAVKVYLNGKYMGVYELTEQIEVGKGRVDIDDTLTGDENGFLVELDSYAFGGDEDDVFFMAGQRSYTVKSDVHNEKQIEYIKNYLISVENAIMDNDRELIEELVDMNSLVDMYLLQEFIKNTDTGYSSFFMSHEVGGKLVFTAPWDFDLSSGNDMRVDNGDYRYIYLGTGRPGYMQNHEWYIRLYSYDWFKNLVIKRWYEINDTVIKELIAEVRAEAIRISPYLVSNFAIWCLPPERIQQEPDHVYKLKSSYQHIEYFLDWLNSRKVWLDRHWALSYQR